MFGQASDLCNHVVKARCGSRGQCPLANLLYHCTSTSFWGNNYLVIPCGTAKAQGVRINADDMAYCLLHMTTRNEHCSACCRDPKCSGSSALPNCP